ncbi:hatching enzyme 1.2 [Eurosta solidaginis]|uniref:hatching enzyme 1.2 n=1 Tax=Eurosta solidaginis TaxID=178769 RepID=UPI003530BCCD
MILQHAKTLFLQFIIYSYFMLELHASPLVDTYAYDYDDSDDTEVVEVDLNTIDELGNNDEHNNDKIDLSFYGNALYGKPDNETTANLVANYTPEQTSVNPEELGSYLEGDILVPIRNNASVKNGIASESSRWPNGVVPFEIRGNFNARDMATIEEAIEQYHRRTCIRFVPRRSESDYVSIVNAPSGCWSAVGRVGGKQEVNLQSPGCLMKPGTAMHELMHALGFLHEQNRQERDSFVSIQIQNVQPSAVTNFEKAQRTVAYGVPYDYGSVMHYSPNAFSRNGLPTIVAVRPGGSERMGQRDGFSAYDIEKLNAMYKCDASSLGGGSFGGNVGVPASIPGGVPEPVPAPSPVQPAPVVNVIGSFLGGLISGLGLGEEINDSTSKADTTKANSH